MKNPRIKTVIKGLLQQYAVSPDALSQAFGVGPLHRSVVQVIDDVLYSSSGHPGECTALFDQSTYLSLRQTQTNQIFKILSQIFSTSSITSTSLYAS